MGITIIGDLMPGVVQGFVGSEPAYDFLVDRHFWVTAFMQSHSQRPRRRWGMLTAIAQRMRRFRDLGIVRIAIRCSDSDIFSHCSHRCRCACDAPRHLPYGNRPRRLRHLIAIAQSKTTAALGYVNCDSAKNEALPRSRYSLILCAVAVNIPQRRRGL
jgi:hypothetical protein